MIRSVEALLRPRPASVVAPDETCFPAGRPRAPRERGPPELATSPMSGYSLTEVGGGGSPTPSAQGLAGQVLDDDVLDALDRRGVRLRGREVALDHLRDRVVDRRCPVVRRRVAVEVKGALSGEDLANREDLEVLG